MGFCLGHSCTWVGPKYLLLNKPERERYIFHVSSSYYMKSMKSP